LRVTRKQRGGVAVAPNPHEDNVEEGTSGIDPVRTVEAAQLRFVQRGGLGLIRGACRNRKTINPSPPPSTRIRSDGRRRA
jgi:hypothetical protein